MIQITPNDVSRLQAWWRDGLQDSRALLAKIIWSAGGRFEEHPIDEVDAAGDALSIGVGWLGPERPSRVVALLSGTHGVEGPAGAAIQGQFVAADMLRQPLAADEAVLIVHAVNPYGWFHGRRANEDNVDLNRNFRDFDEPLPASEDYLELDRFINPRDLSAEADAMSRHGLEQARDRLGNDQIRRVIMEGQHVVPDGVHFGGTAPTRSNGIVREIFAKAFAQAGAGVVLDLHTGMGAFGDWMAISGEGPDSEGDRWISRAISPQRLARPYATGDIDGAPATQGKLARAVCAAAGHGSFRSLTLEFGTYAGIRVFRAEQRENCLFKHATADHELAAEIRAEMWECYVPASARWRASVMAGGAAAIAEVRKALSE